MSRFQASLMTEVEVRGWSGSARRCDDDVVVGRPGAYRGALDIRGLVDARDGEGLADACEAKHPVS